MEPTGPDRNKESVAYWLWNNEGFTTRDVARIVSKSQKWFRAVIDARREADQ